jgi:peptide/nickel transport system substrate-binding protein
MSNGDPIKNDARLQVSRRWVLAATSGLAGLAAAGLPIASPSARADDTPQKGGTVKLGRVADVMSFDPVFPTDNMSIWAKLLVFQMLIRSDPTGTKLEPDLAESWEASDDRMTYTFHMRKNAAFSDGTPVKSSDVKFSINRMVTAEGSPWASMFPKMQIETPDDNTIVFKLAQAWGPFLEDISVHGTCVVPEAYFKKLGDKAFGDKPMGSGPFQLVQWDKGDKIVMQRNPHFWDPSRPYLDEVQLLVLADDNIRMLKVQTGEIDIATDVPYNQIDKLSAMPNLTVQLTPYDRIDWIQFNEKVDKFQDVKVRQAINWAVDKEGIIKSVLFGHGEVPTSFLPKMRDADTQTAPYGYDPAKAKQLMSESKFPQGFKSKLTVASGDTIGQQVATIVKAELAAIGIDIDILQLEGATQYGQLASGDYEMAEGYMTSDIIDPSELTAYAGAGDEGTSAVWTFYNNPDVNKLATQALSETDPAKRTQIYLKMQQQIHEDAPYLWLYWSPARTAIAKSVHGFKVLPTGNYWLEDVWKS